MNTKLGACFKIARTDESRAGVKVWFTIGDRLQWHYFPNMRSKEGKAVVRAMVKAGKII